MCTAVQCDARRRATIFRECTVVTRARSGRVRGPGSTRETSKFHGLRYALVIMLRRHSYNATTLQVDDDKYTYRFPMDRNHLFAAIKI